MKIYCKKKLSKRSKKEFLHQYFDSRTPTTYYFDTKIRQCEKNKNRSIGDLKALLDGSFKTTTSKNKTILLLMELLAEKEIKCLKCPTIRKIVFLDKNKSYWTYYVSKIERKYNYMGASIGTDGYCFNDLLEIYDNKKK